MSSRRTNAREVLQCLERIRGATVLIAPFGVEHIPDPVRKVLIQDAQYLCAHGVDVVFVEYPSSSVWTNSPAATTHLADDSDSALLQALRKHGAARLCFASRTDTLTTMQGHRLDAIPLADAQTLLRESERIDSFTKAGLRKAVVACTDGKVERVHFFNAWTGAFLDELLTNHGAGTMVHTGEPYRLVRRAQSNDRPAMDSLLDILPERIRQDIAPLLEDTDTLRVLTLDGAVDAVARLSYESLDGEYLHVLRVLLRSPSAEPQETFHTLLDTVKEEVRAAGSDHMAIVLDEHRLLIPLLPWLSQHGWQKERCAFPDGDRDVWRSTIAA